MNSNKNNFLNKKYNSNFKKCEKKLKLTYDY